MIRIAHLSDIQIRLFKRLDEFRQHLENLYVSLREKKPDYIVLAGDILHNKSQISAEQIDLFIDFLSELAEIASVHLIAGNHDSSLNNLSRLDAISPIVKALGSSRISYHKHSGIYPVNDNLNFVVFSCLDKNWPTEKDIDKTKINIGLFHGMVYGAVLQNEIAVEDSTYCLRPFLDMVDYLMLGDIHKMQILDMEYRAAYCGSLIQQNYGESVNKGYLFWEIEDKKEHEVDFVKLPNICPFYTLRLEDGLSIPENLDFQKKSRIRVFSRQLNVFEKKTLADKIDSLYDPCELIFLDDNVQRQEIKIYSPEGKIEDLASTRTQEKLIKDFLKNRNLSEAFLQHIFDINKFYDAKAREKDETLRNVQYKLGKMHFSNMFSYGENNVFDFSKYKGIVGVFGRSGSGKSSLVVDIPLYCIFNKISKKGVVKNDLIINENKEDCGVELEVAVGKHRHVIRRATHVYLKSGNKQKSPNYQGKTDVEFEVHQEDGTIENRIGEERSVTDKNIRKVFGSLEDFIATSMSPQWQLLGIVDTGGTDRQKLIGRYFDIDIFSQKFKLANEEWKSIKGQLKVFQDRNFEEEFINANKIFCDIKNSIETCQNKRKEIVEKIKNIEQTIAELRLNIVRVSIDSKLKEEDILNKINKLKLEIKTLQHTKTKIIQLTEKKNSFDIVELEKKRSLWREIRELEDRAKALEEGCSCQHKESCPLGLKVKKIKKEAADIRFSLGMTEKNILEKIEKYNQIVIPKDVDFPLQFAERNLKDAELEIKLLLENKEQIVKNTEAENKIQALLDQKTEPTLEVGDLDRKLLSLSSEMGKWNSNLLEIDNSKEKYEEIKKEYGVYHCFLSAMSKDGIVKKIISENLEIVNAEIKKILSKGVGFSIELASEEDGKAIEIYFKHERSKKRRIEICSGMEKSISSLVIRSALMNVTTLPKCNIFVLDEPFGFLDAECKDAVAKILDYLKNLYDSIILVTHDEYFKDIVDHVIEVDRDSEGYSKICE